MGVHKLMLLAMLLFSFCSHASLSPVTKNSVSVNTHENEGDNGSDYRIGGGSRSMANESKYTTAARASRGGGVAGGNGGSLIPVYAANAGGKNGIRKSAAPCKKRASNLVLIATSASLLLHMSLYKI